MNYTQNYHLPQWEETDRVLMQDFNAAMLGIDTGMAAMAPLARAADNIGRDLYRRTVQQWVKQGAVGRNDSMWINPLLTSADAGGEGHGWNGRYGVSLGHGCLPTVEGIRASAHEHQFITTLPAITNKKYFVKLDFVSDGYGTIDTLTIWTLRSEGYTSEEFTFTIRITRLDTGAEVGTAGPFRSASYAKGFRETAYPVGFPLEPNVKYQMEFSLPTGSGYIGAAGFALKSAQYSGNAVPMTIVPRAAEPTIVKTVAAPDYATGALGLIRWRGTGTVGLSINGEPMTATRTRESANAEGIPCQETEFFMPTLPTGALTVTTEMNSDSDLDVFDYGLIWR